MAGVSQRPASSASAAGASLRCYDFVDPWCRLRGSEQQRVRLLAAPGLEAALKRSQKLVRIGPRIFLLQPGQKLAACPPWLGFEPFSQVRCGPGERVGTTPASLCFHDRPIRRSHSSVLPGGSQTCQEEIDRLGCCSRAGSRLRIGERGQALLRGADIAQQRDWVEADENFLETGANFVGRALVGGQSLMRRRRRAIRLVHPRAVALLRDQLERGLEEVHVQSR